MQICGEAPAAFNLIFFFLPPYRPPPPILYGRRAPIKFSNFPAEGFKTNLRG
jgi:hypothetical protein